MSVARSGLASPSRRCVEPKEIRAQAREVRMASSATRANQGAQGPHGQMPSQKRMTTAVSQGQSLACQRRASHIKINTEQGLFAIGCSKKERKAMNRIR